MGPSTGRLRPLSRKLISNSGICVNGRKVSRFRCSRLKTCYYNLTKPKDRLSIPAVVLSLFKTSYKSNIVACLQYVNGSMCYIPATHGMKVGSLVNHLSLFTQLNYNNTKLLTIGSSLQLNKLPRFSVISNLHLDNTSKSTYARSAGTYAFVEEFLNDLKLCIVKLPSGARKLVNHNTIVTLGRNYNKISSRIVIGKAGVNINKGKKQITRGVAMNPVDHPNGGRTKTNKPEKSL